MCINLMRHDEQKITIRMYEKTKIKLERKEKINTNNFTSERTKTTHTQTHTTSHQNVHDRKKTSHYLDRIYDAENKRSIIFNVLLINDLNDHGVSMLFEQIRRKGVLCAIVAVLLVNSTRSRWAFISAMSCHGCNLTYLLPLAFLAPN